MIVALAARMELVLFSEHVDGGCVVSGGNLPSNESLNYFLCLPQHNENGQCLHWLNGGEVEFRRGGEDWQDEDEQYHGLAGYCGMMNSDVEFRIKPRKEKRWIAIYSDGTVCDRNKRTKEEIATYVERAPFYNNCAPENWQFFEIDLEVK